MISALASLTFTVAACVAVASLARDARRFPSIVRNLAHELERL